jgi:hypothetical protein
MVPKDAELDPAGKKIKDPTRYRFPLTTTMKAQLIARVKTDSFLQVLTKSRCFSLSPKVMVASSLDLGYRKEKSLRQGVGLGRPPTNEVMPEQKLKADYESRLCLKSARRLLLYFKQCCGSGSESGSTCFWPSWIRIRIH